MAPSGPTPYSHRPQIKHYGTFSDCMRYTLNDESKVDDRCSDIHNSLAQSNVTSSMSVMNDSEECPLINGPSMQAEDPKSVFYKVRKPDRSRDFSWQNLNSHGNSGLRREKYIRSSKRRWKNPEIFKVSLKCESIGAGNGIKISFSFF
ncbi:hypothetical protein MDV093 [Gallid alphaherpesvirus 2]|uniref:Uncharacterized 16.7 kDa protein n=3 Tax=Gallid alphaherpesvirus 2 TaxID=10390 RepID=US441_GAHVG|nr:RecName: Full=Uncharacterized 16.7 kDa protein [Marek's disease herpesvirus strain GA]pir/G48552/ ORF-US441 - infectious laryngotracheitis virus [Gallid alphaherpesvirus 1]AAA64966.1 ORF4 [Gallid alphaherpesvirus 2]AEV55067.1 SORF4 [Gallid herpesvirus 2 strain 814]AAB59896.1 unknown protein [Gallid alphaherpesvirus 1]AAT65015.1 SORF4 [Gallid alphaherpesvirus 2]ABF72363.1 hypothetical protein MDV093 [Gallid alphaherpesvirus 2]